jgi:BirA family biotin operon repressor/biotin-[acetyl-CoA-carboxylase] ligase
MTGQFIVWHHETVGSTNDEVRRLAATGAPHGTVVYADEQTNGRGRRQHQWFSPIGNLYISVLLRTGQPVYRVSQLSFVSALAVADTVDGLLPRQVRAMLKWPNDVLVQGAKIAGILIEQIDEATIIGIGLNVLEAPTRGAYKTTTIIANGGIASVDSAKDLVLDCLDRHLKVWRTAGFAAIRHQWVQRSYPAGTAIRVNLPSGQVTGAFAGLDVDGALLLDTPGGRERIVAGDTAPAGG